MARSIIPRAEVQQWFAVDYPEMWSPAGKAWTPDVSQEDCPVSELGGWFDQPERNKSPRFELDPSVAHHIALPAENLANDTASAIYVLGLEGVVLFPSSISGKSDKDLDAAAILNPHWSGKAMSVKWDPYKKGRCIYFTIDQTGTAPVSDDIVDGKRAGGKLEFLAEPAKKGEFTIIIGGAQAEVNPAPVDPTLPNPTSSDSTADSQPSESASTTENTASGSNTAPSDSTPTNPSGGSGAPRFSAVKFVAGALAGALVIAVLA